MSGVERYELKNGFSIGFDRTLALPPDEVTIAQGLGVSYALEHQRAAEILYDSNPDPYRARRVLDLGSGVGTFLVAAIAGHKNPDLPVTFVGVEKDENVYGLAVDNIKKNMDISKSRNAALNFSVEYFTGDWYNQHMWDALGTFDWIYCNPPYLTLDTPVIEGYQDVPSDHVYSDDLAAMYGHIYKQGLERLNPLGTMVVRSSSKDFGGTHTQSHESIESVVDTAGLGYLVLNSWTIYGGGRAGVVTSVTNTPEMLPPYGDPRVMHFLRTGNVIQI